MIRFKEHMNEAVGMGLSGLKEYVSKNSSVNPGEKRINVLVDKIRNNKEVLLIDNTKVVFVNQEDIIADLLDYKLQKLKTINGDIILLTKIAKSLDFGGQFGNVDNLVGVTIKNIPFGSGGNTIIGESIQCIGFFYDPGTIEDFTYNKTKDLDKILDKIDVHDKEGPKKYWKDEDTFNIFRLSIYQLILNSHRSLSDIGLKPDNIIHKDISSYYKIAKENSYITDIGKENTADVVLYNGNNFLENLNEYEVDSDNYIIKINKQKNNLNEFVQISLKANGRLGDLSSLNKIANKYKYMIYEDFSDFIKQIAKKASNFLYSIPKKVKNFISSFTKKLDKTNSSFEEYEISLMANLGLSMNEKKGVPGAEDFEILSKDKDKFMNIVQVLNKALVEVEVMLKNYGDAVKYKLPKDKIKWHDGIDKDVTRYIYYNTVSVLTLRDFLKSNKNIEEMQYLEREIIYGNTSLPLIKVIGTDLNNYIEFLPMQKDDKMSGKYPILGVSIVKARGLKGHYAIYFHILSTIYIKEPTYIQIQMRTKQVKQYVIDGNITISLDRFMKRYK